MKLTADLSLYPLQEEYIPIIQSFIASLQDRTGLQVARNAMSTQVSGDYDTVFAAISVIPWEIELVK
jgi:uncharacterized protein YqgV (UPF0045/DUF77 family)